MTSTTTTKSTGVAAGMKRADRRSSINILVLGDEGVGKSSLISTFVARYFSEVVPGIMTRVRLPPDPQTSCVTTIVDSQCGDAALMSVVAAQALATAREGALTSSSSESLTALLERTDSALSQSSLATAPALTPASTLSVTAGLQNVDSIVLVYDLDRAETFFRLENHWLPLIERCYEGKVPVIVAENKVDLFRPSNTAGMTDEQALARKRQQIVSLMQRFPFVRQCIKCSAQNLLRVDEVFLKAQQAALYPFTPPLYDLESGRLTPECKRAFTRIFRMYDRDHDGLLSDAELDRFQRDTYHVPVFDRDLAAWKKVVTRHNPSDDEVVIRDSKFTVAGFLAIFDIFISQNRLDVVWQALRKFHYDDDLNLHVPEAVRLGFPSHHDPIEHTQQQHQSQQQQQQHGSWKLSPSAKKFLTSLFRQFDSDRDGRLSYDDMLAIFDILHPPALPPWHPSRAPELFEGCFSLPKESPRMANSASTSPEEAESLILPAAMTQSLSQSGISMLSATDSLPSVDVGGIHPISDTMSYLNWMGHWHAIATISPAVARAELFRLGHVEEATQGRSRGTEARRRSQKRAAVSPSDWLHDATLPSREIRVMVLGSQGCGKTALLNALCGSFDGVEMKPTDTERTIRPETSTTHFKIKRKGVAGSTKIEDTAEEIVFHVVFTDVPETAGSVNEERFRDLSDMLGSTNASKEPVCDLVMLVFDGTQPASLAYVKELEAKLLTVDMPRIFVATKADVWLPAGLLQGAADLSSLAEGVVAQCRESNLSLPLEEAVAHCRESDLELPLIASASSIVALESLPKSGIDDRKTILQHLAGCAVSEPGMDRLKSRPHEEQKRRESSRRRNFMWLGGLVTVGVAVALGVGFFWSGASNRKESKSGFGWLRDLFGGGSSPTKRSPT